MTLKEKKNHYNGYYHTATAKITTLPYEPMLASVQFKISALFSLLEEDFSIKFMQKY